ncbi:MAG: SIS domain-containing protein [Xanthobacteraceae bacterium]|nr:MAG: SIS domain-containing protein [Xanthobacteraceae bacterium]
MANDSIAAHFERSRAALDTVASDRALLETIGACAATITAALRNGGKLLIAGNGGSAADAQHIAAELVGRYKRERAALPAIALTTDTSALTAIGNDYGFDEVFARQLRALGRPGDVLLAISTSGRSPNILAAIAAAREMDIAVIGFTGGGGGDMRALCRHWLGAPGGETAVIQQIHMVAAHAICDAVELALMGAEGA